MLRRIAAHVVAGDEPQRPDEPLGSLEGAHPRLRTFSAAQLVGGRQQFESTRSLEAASFPPALRDDHPAVQQFQRFGYLAITDMLTPAALARATTVFRAKQAKARAVWKVALAEDPVVQADSEAHQYFDLPREDMPITPEAWNSGAWGGFLVTKDAADLDSYMEMLANQRVLPLIQALVGPSLHIMEAGARTVVAQPREDALRTGGYTDWHRDYGSDGLRMPIGAPGGDYVSHFSSVLHYLHAAAVSLPPYTMSHTSSARLTVRSYLIDRTESNAFACSKMSRRKEGRSDCVQDHTCGHPQAHRTSTGGPTSCSSQGT